MKNLSILNCIECYEVNNYNDIENLPVVYRQNQALKYLVNDYNLVVDKGVAYAFNKANDIIECAFSAIRQYEVKAELSYELKRKLVTREWLINKIKGE